MQDDTEVTAPAGTQVPPPVQIIQMATAYWVSRAVSVVEATPA